MPAIIAQSVGVDIANDTLDAHLHPAGRVGRFANNACGYAALTAIMGRILILANTLLRERRTWSPRPA